MEKTQESYVEMGFQSTQAEAESGLHEQFVGHLGFEGAVIQAEAGLMFEQEFNSENEDDEELQHGRMLLKKLVTKDKSVGRGKGLNKENQNVDEGLNEDEADNDTDYFTSSDEGSYKFESDAEEDGTVRKKSRFPSFKPSYTVDFSLGMSFESKSEAKDAMDKYSMSNRYPYYWAKNCADMLRAKCSNLNKGCTWMVYIAIDNRSCSNKWVVKTYHSKHTCNPGWQIPSATASWLVKNFFKSKAGVCEMKVASMREMVKKELNCDVSLEQMRKAKSMLRKLEKGDIEAEYRDLEDYKEEILRSNGGNTCILQLLQPSPVFDRFYVCFHACKKGFLEGCRRLIGIDGAFLKTEVKGEILTAVARDANNQMFPIAWAVVASETKSTWKWFLENLREDLHIGRGKGWAFVSDQQKGLMPALYETLPEVEHRRCARHIYAIWRRSHPGLELQRQFWKCCKCASKKEFELNLEVLKTLSPSAHDDILKIDPKFWCRAFFNRSIKCETVDNNLCEAFNGVIVPARSQFGFSQLEYIRKLVMQRLIKNRELGEKWVGQLGPRIRRRINKAVMESNNWRVLFNGSDGYEVSCGSHTYLVDLDNMSCLCEQWDVSGIPCKHAICAIRDKGHRIEDYVSQWYKKDMYCHTYAEMMTPIAGPLFWPKTNIKVMPAELKKKKNWGDQGEIESKRLVRFLVLARHNKRGCPSKDQILQGTTTFPNDFEAGSSKSPKKGSEKSTQNVTQETDSTFAPPNETNVEDSRLKAYFQENTDMQETNRESVFQFRGQNVITAAGLERLRQRKGKENAERSSKARQSNAAQMEPTGISTTARNRFNDLFDSMEDPGGN